MLLQAINGTAVRWWAHARAKRPRRATGSLPCAPKAVPCLLAWQCPVTICFEVILDAGSNHALA